MKKYFCFYLILFLSILPKAWALEKNDSFYSEQKTNIVVSPTHSQFVIKLKSNPTTGYSWFLRKYNSEFIQPVNHHFQSSDNPKLVGAPGYELWTFKVKAEGFRVPHLMPLSFIYARPWEKNNSVSELTFWVSTGK